MNYSKPTFVGLGILLIAIALIAVNFFPSNEPDGAVATTHSEKKHRKKKSTPQKQFQNPHSSTASTNRNKPTVTEADSATQVAEREAAIEKMDEASTSYDPAELPIIRPYLESADPLLREAAVNAMIVLGDASAGPMLREAAQKLPSSEESKKMMEAADYVELPSANLKEISEMLKKRKEENRKGHGSNRLE